MANNCGTCKHWESRIGQGPMGLCHKINCDYDTIYDLTDKTPRPIAYTHACETADSELLTQADFGCVLWEKQA